MSAYTREIEFTSGKGERFRVTITLDESKLDMMARHQAWKAIASPKGKATAAQGFVVVHCQKAG